MQQLHKLSAGEKNRGALPILGICGVLIALAVLTFTLYNGKEIRDRNHAILINDTREAAENLERVMMEGRNNIEILSKLVSESLTEPEVDVASYQKLIQHTTFDFMEFADKDGMNHNITGNISDASDRKYYLDAMQGNTGTEIVYNSRATHENLLMFYSPVTCQGEIIGSLVGVFQASNRLKNLLALDYFGESTTAYLCNREGRIFASNLDIDATKELYLEDMLTLDEENAAVVHAALQSAEPASFLQKHSQTSGFLMPLQGQEWILVQIYPAAINVQMIRSANAKAMVLLAAVLVILAAMQILFYENHKKQEAKLENMLSTLQQTQRKESQQLAILKSMAGIYYSMHLIDLEHNTATEYIALNDVKELLGDPAVADEAMRRVIQGTITEGHLAVALDFTDLHTLPERMRNKKAVFMDLLGMHVGWIRFSFITIEADDEGRPTKVIGTTQIIDEEKRKEEKLLKESNTDELTGCLNRRAHDDFLMNHPLLPDNFIYVAMDVNGLKTVNDSAGHEAGDELIVGAVECMRRCLGSYGSIYRTGGDEFAAMICAAPYVVPHIMQDFEEAQHSWHGKLVDALSISYGYISREEFPELQVSEMVKIADQRMYAAKSEYYKTKGIDRRGQSAAYSALCALYTKILKVNLTEDTYQIITMNMEEQREEKGFSQAISGWLRGFGNSGQVHPEDREMYLKETELPVLRQAFRKGKAAVEILYRRKIGAEYKMVMMEMIPTKEYTDDNQTIFLFVKPIEK